MKQLTCEMCGSTDLMKQDGVFVCQTCGAKYSVEDAKKMMVEGTVDVSGSTIKIDSSEELQKLLQLARRARENSDNEGAAKYYDMILQKEPNNWEAAFFSVYCRASNSTVREIPSSAALVANAVSSTVGLIKELPEEKQDQAIHEVVIYLKRFTGSAYSTVKALDQKLEHGLSDFGTYIGACGDCLIHAFGAIELAYGENESIMQTACSLLTETISYYVDNYNTMYKQAPRIASENLRPSQENLINILAKRIKGYLPNYQAPVLQSYVAPAASSGGGCYVATAVYGSYDCPQVWTLRRYRDYTLAETWYGRAFIRTYYAVSPTLVKWFGETAWFKKMWQGKLDRMVAKLQAEGVEATPYKDKEW